MCATFGLVGAVQHDTSEVDSVVVDTWRLNIVEANTYMSEMHADCTMPRKIRKAAQEKHG
eukprot:12907240-Prorocentrum_lima.AAC.1